jgi:hypothetical protein
MPVISCTIDRSSPFIGGQHWQPIQMGHRLHISGSGGEVVYILYSCLCVQYHHPTIPKTIQTMLNPPWVQCWIQAWVQLTLSPGWATYILYQINITCTNNFHLYSINKSLKPLEPSMVRTGVDTKFREISQEKFVSYFVKFLYYFRITAKFRENKLNI